MIDDSQSVVSQVNKGLTTLKRRNIDALWLAGDNALLNTKVLTKSWIPRLKQTSVSVVTSLENLIHTDLVFANFAVAPAQDLLAIQAVDAAIDIIHNDWASLTPKIQEPIAINAHVNAYVSERKGITLKNNPELFVEMVTQE